MLLREYIGQAIKKERLAQNRTLRGVSGRAYVSLGYLSEIERGIKEVSSGVLEDICKSLYITVSDLIIDVAVTMQEASVSDLTIQKELLNGNHATVHSSL